MGHPHRLVVTLLAGLLAGCGHAAVPTAPVPSSAPATVAPSVTVTPEADTASVTPPQAVAELMANPKLTDVKASSITDPWRPSAFTITDTDHNAITLNWRTTLSARAVVYYAKSFGFDWHGFTNSLTVDDSRTNHTVRIEGLSRFTRYRFVVVGLGPVGTQFPSYAIEQRTSLFF